MVTVKAYNEMADYCYANLEEKMIVGMQGSINSKIEVILDNVEAQM